MTCPVVRANSKRNFWDSLSNGMELTGYRALMCSMLYAPRDVVLRPLWTYFGYNCYESFDSLDHLKEWGRLPLMHIDVSWRCQTSGWSCSRYVAGICLKFVNWAVLLMTILCQSDVSKRLVKSVINLISLKILYKLGLSLLRYVECTLKMRRYIVRVHQVVPTRRRNIVIIQIKSTKIHFVL